MSYVNSLFTRKRTIEIKEGSHRRSILVSMENSKVKELQEQVNLERHKTLKLEDNIRKVEESLSNKREEFEKQIKELREQIMYYRLNPTPTTENISKHIEETEVLHKKVLDTINDFKLQIEEQIKDQEKDINKRFDLKLAKICNEIEERKKKRIMELTSMANTEKKASKDLDNLRESAIIVEKKNVFLEEENKKLEQQIKQKDQEFQELMQQFYYSKRKINSISHVSVESNFVPQTTKYSTTGTEDYEDKTDRYENVISKLRKQLENERKNLKAVRNEYVEEIEDRTEMENVVRRFVEEIRNSQRGRPNSLSEERAILVDLLFNSSEVFNILNRSPFQLMSRDVL